MLRVSGWVGVPDVVLVVRRVGAQVAQKAEEQDRGAQECRVFVVGRCFAGEPGQQRGHQRRHARCEVVHFVKHRPATRTALSQVQDKCDTQACESAPALCLAGPREGGIEQRRQRVCVGKGQPDQPLPHLALIY
jgi:hypothetical protein